MPGVAVTETYSPAGTFAFGQISPFDDERTPFVVARQAPPKLDALLQQFTAWIVLPAHVAAPPSRLPGLIQRVRALTGWSTRDLAEVIGTSHTTVRMFETNGRVSARSRQAAARITPLLGVLTRLRRLVDTPQALAVALATPSDTGERAIDLLAAREWARGFVVGLDAVHGPRPNILTPNDDWPLLPATREMR